MPYKDLEHDGGEDFSNNNPLETREDVLEKKIRRDKDRPTKEESLERLQKHWLSLENPHLWDGEI